MKLNNFHDIWTVIKFTMRDMVSRKSFRVSTIIILVLIVLGFNAPNFLQTINGGNFNDTILISDPNQNFTQEIDHIIFPNDAPSTTPQISYQLELTDDSLEIIKEKINTGKADAAIILDQTGNELVFEYYVKNIATANTSNLETITEQIQKQYFDSQITKLGLTTNQLQTLYPTTTQQFFQTDDQEVGGNIFVMMMLSIVLFFAIYFCAFQVSSSITIEKTSKIMETLVTSTSPRTIILGKTIGIGLVGLGQILLFTIVAIISAYTFLDSEILNSILDLSNFTVYLAAIMIIYFILGYFAYALLYALTGSTVSKPEDIQSANTPVAILTMFGFYLAYFTLTDPTSSLNAFAALFPFSSPFCMPIRVMMGIANVWEVLLSLIILIITCAIIAHVAIKIYSSAILNYGTKMSFKDIIKTYKDRP